ncbi:MAG: hypothetical protein MZV70_37680 [Desulfobacterales bacterium]|nr:hypothetical protein [Desulfobacterales bacterium]
MATLGISIDCSRPGGHSGCPASKACCAARGSSLPPLATTIGYTARIRTEAILRRGLLPGGDAASRRS